MRPRFPAVSIALLVVMIAGMVAFVAWANFVVAPPLDEAFPFGSSPVLDRDIEIPTADDYRLEFVFSTLTLPYSQVQQLLGETRYDLSRNLVETGAELSIRWEFSQGGSVIAGATTTTRGIAATTSGKVMRGISRVSVPPGAYHFHAEVIAPDPRIAALAPRIQMTLHPFVFRTSKVAAARWGLPGSSSSASWRSDWSSSGSASASIGGRGSDRS